MRIAMTWPVLISCAVLAQPRDATAAGAVAEQARTTIVCGAKPGERQTCAANTTAGVTLVRVLGTSTCELGPTWGYDAAGVWVADGCSAEFSVAEPPPGKFGRYSPATGFTIADTDQGQLNIRMWSYVRYLSQRFVDPTYIDAFGNTRDVRQRQDFQVNKVQVYFQGWLFDPKFRYNTYIWSSNATQGQSTQVVVAGDLRYTVNPHFTLGVGIGSGLPGTRSMEGVMPNWLMLDERQIADEFFRPSYTTGIFANGLIGQAVRYQVMWGNNLSQFGIDGGQLDNSLDTLSMGLVWMPTTGEFSGGLGDLAGHEELATRFGVHYSRSNENRQAQPNTDAFDNVQLRVSDGSVIFSPGLFAEGVQIDEATYQMVSVDGGLKYQGISFDAEYYWRRLDNFETLGTGGLPFTDLHDTGFQVLASAMPVPHLLQVYGGASKVFGQYGDPYDGRIGANFYPWGNNVVRWNNEVLYVNRSPVGSVTLPYSVGSNGPVFHSSVMVFF